MRPTPLFRPVGTGERRMQALSLNAFLTRLIWLCVLPLVILAVYLAINHVRVLQDQRDREAENQAHNVATTIDRHLGAQIAALQMLAASPLMDEPPRLNEFYNEAQGFRESFGGHVILADLATQMIFNTRVPFGSVLPKLPRPEGHAAAPAVLATGKPAVGDMFIGPIAREPLATAVVPLVRDGQMKYLLVSAIETRQFERSLGAVALPAEWTLKLLDGKNEVMAHRSPPQIEGYSAEEEPPRRFVVDSNVSHWSVVLEIPRGVYRKPIIAAIAALVAAILAVTLVSVLGGRLAGRRLARSVAALAKTPSPETSRPVIAEIEAVRSLLTETAAAREAAEATRRESEQRFRQLFDVAPVPLCFVAKDGVLLNINTRFKQTFGYGHDDVPNLSEWWQLAYPDPDYRRWVVETWEAAVQRARDNNADIEPIEYRVTCKDGKVLTVVISGTIIGDDFLATLFDITERKHAEDLQQTLLNRFYTVLSSLHAGILLVTEDGQIEFANKAFCDLFDLRCSPEDLRRLSASDTLQKIRTAYADPDGAVKRILEILEQGLPVTSEEVSLRYGRTCLRDFIPLDMEGKHYGRLWNHQDITQRKRAEEALRESQEKLKLALTSMTDAVFISDKQGRFIDFNDAFATFHRFRNKDECLRSQAEYPDILDVFMPNGELAPLNMWAVPRALRGETAMDAEYILRRKDTGETWDGSYSFAPIRDQDGGIVGSVVVGRDITERKKADNALRSSLEEKVALLKEVHHRVKNNLQIVASLLGLQARRSSSQQVVDVLQDTRNRVKAMAMLHEALYRSGNLARINFATYMKDLCGQLLLSYGPVANRVKLENRVTRIGLPLEHAVPCGLIASELVSNALKHGFPGERTGTVVVGLDQADGRMLVLSVHDDGMGLPSGLDPDRTSTLGLQLVSRLATQLGGQLEVDSSHGVGATFRVIFPVPKDTVVEGES
jgi:PAS domain S-box-containing protein